MKHRAADLRCRPQTARRKLSDGTGPVFAAMGALALAAASINLGAHQESLSSAALLLQDVQVPNTARSVICGVTVCTSITQMQI